MQGKSRSTAGGFILAVAASFTVSGKGAAAPPCPAVADVEKAIGYPVKALRVAVDGCLFELTGRYRGVMVSLMYQPATRANDVYADIRKRVKAKGMKAEPDRL